MKIISFLLVSLSIFWGANLKAEVQTSAWTQVANIYQDLSNQSTYIIFKGSSLQGCHANSGGYLKDGPGSARIYSNILTALTAAREVLVYYKLNDMPSDYNGWGLCDITALYLK